MTSRAAGSGKGVFSARMRGSTWPCGQTSGRPAARPYSSRAMFRTPGDGSKYRSRLSISPRSLSAGDPPPGGDGGAADDHLADHVEERQPPRPLTGERERVVRI